MSGDVTIHVAPDLRAEPGLEDLFAAMYDHFAAVTGRDLLKPEAFTAWSALYTKVVGRSRQVVVARVGDKLVGFAEGLVRAPPSYYRGGPRGFVAQIYVAPAARGLKVALRMFEELKRWFIASGAGEIELQVLSGNVGAERFWATLGFQPDNQQMRITL